MSPPEELQWFAEHVQPHEPAVRAYLASRFPSLQDQDDVVQESFSRMLRAQTKGDGIRHARAFFFSTAHNVAVDLFRRRARNEHVEMTDLHELPALEEARGVGDLLDERQRHERRRQQKPANGERNTPIRRRRMNGVIHRKS